MPQESHFRRTMTTIRSQMLSGLLVLIPLGITIMILKLFFAWTAGIIVPLIKEISGDKLKDIHVSLIAIGVFIILIYVVGVITAAVMGKKLVQIAESLLMRIPVVRGVYSVSKQVVHALSLPNRDSFTGVVLVDFPRPGMKAIGFLTGTMTDQQGKIFHKVFVPAAPLPSSGFLEIVKPEDSVATDMSVEDGFKMIMSGGIISPDRCKMGPQNEQT